MLDRLRRRWRAARPRRPSRTTPRSRARRRARRRHEVVGRALEQEGLHEVAAPGADRAGDAHLGAALGGEHHEDQEDQQDAGRDREAPERREHLHERGARLVGRLQAVPLHGLRLEPARLEHGTELRRSTASCAPRRSSSPPRFDTRISSTLPRHAERALRVGERHEHRRLRGSGSAVARRRRRRGARERVPAGQDRDACRPGALRAQSAAVAVEYTDPARAHRAAPVVRRARDRAEARPGAAGRARRGSTRGSVWRDVVSWTATVRMIAGVTPSTRPEPRATRSTSATTCSSNSCMPALARRPRQ